MTTRRALARAGVVVTSAFLISRILGWLRLVVLGTIFGGQGQLDTFFAAFRIPDLIFQLVAAGAVSSALIPTIAGMLATDRERRAWQVVSTITNLMLIGLLVLTTIFAIGAPEIMRAITPGFDAVQLEQTVRLTRMMLLSPILLALGSIATSVLNSRGMFAASAVAPIVYNASIIIAAIVGAPFLGVEALALGVVIGSLGHLLIQLRPLIRSGFQYEPVIDTSDPEARQTLALMAPRAVGLGVTQITFLVATTLASGLAAGSITALNIAFTVLQIPIGLIGVPLGIVLLPSMARELARGAVAEYVRLLTRAIRLILYVMLPVTGLMIVLRRQIVALLFDYGRFDTASVDLTANTLLYFLLGLAAHSLIAVLARAFYAGRDTKTPVAAAIVAVVVNTTFGILTVGSLGLSGLALGIAVGAWVETGILLAILWRRVPGFELGGIGRVTLEAAAGTAVASAVAVGLVRLVDALAGPDPGKVVYLVQVIVAGAGAAAAYALVSVVLRIPELPSIVRLMTDVLPETGAPVRVRVDADDWDAVVISNEHGSYLQTTPWAAVKAANGWAAVRPRGPIGTDPHATIGAQVLIRRPRGMPWAFGYAPRGPVASDWSERAVGSFTATLRRRVGRGGVDGMRLSHLRIDPEIERDGPDDPEGALRRALSTAGWQPAPAIQPETTRIIDLRPDEDDLWSDLRKKWRQYVNKARANGIVIREGEVDRLPDFYRIYGETAHRAGFLIRTEAAYRDIWEAFRPRGMARLLIAESEDGEPQAALFLVSCGSRVVEPYGGMTAAGAESRANYLLKWEAIRSSRAAGALSYDLWGLAHPGIAHFKEGFGGREVRYIGAWDLVIDRIGRRVYDIGQRSRIWVARRRHGLSGAPAIGAGTGASTPDGGA